MTDLYFVVNKYRLDIINGMFKSNGNTDEYTCHFKFISSDWVDMTSRVAVFKSAAYNIAKVVTINSDCTCTIPWELTCKPGIIICAVTGTKVEDSTVVSKIVTNPEYTLLVEDISTENVSYSTTPTPTEYEQFVVDIQDSLIDYFNANGFSYEALIDKPSIESVELIGDLEFSDFGYPIASVSDIDAMF